MSTFDPNSVHQAVEDFKPRRPQRFHELYSAMDVIAELRQKRASYRSIAELLTQHCLPISKTAVAAFCHEVLGEIVRPRKRPGRKRSLSTSSPKSEQIVDTVQTPGKQTMATHTPTDQPKADQAPPSRTRGPRIAQVRMAK